MDYQNIRNIGIKQLGVKMGTRITKEDNEDIWDHIDFKVKTYTPETLWKKAVKYFRWTKKHNLKERKAFGTGLEVDLPKMRPFTEIGFCLYAGISQEQLRLWKLGKSGNESKAKEGEKQYSASPLYMKVANRIADVIYRQKFDGAAADLLNANIISRELGLVDKVQSTNINLNADIEKQDVLRISGLLDNDV